MIKFLLKGILGDKSRSLLPIVVISLGVALTVLMHGWITGVMGDSVELNADFNTGHVKIMTRAYAADDTQLPNDLAILEADSVVKSLRAMYPDMEWVERIRFGGLIDFPDTNGETRAQGPVMGWGLDLLSPESKEAERFNLKNAVLEGRIPVKAGEALISSELADKFKVKAGDTFTLFGTSMDGGMAFKNLRISGTVRFGVSAIDRGALIADIRDIQQALGMQHATGELLGFFSNSAYNNDHATRMMNEFNDRFSDKSNEFSPVMVRLRDQGGLADYLDIAGVLGSVMVTVFVLAMAVVLWNAGLLGGLRRYNEFGIRLALGEEKKHIYRTLIYEALLIGTIGSVLGSILGLGASYYMQEVGLNIGNMMKGATLMLPTVARTSITPVAFYIGFIPGIVSMVLGNALAGIAIYKRNTARLFKELEA